MFPSVFALVCVLLLARETLSCAYFSVIDTAAEKTSIYVTREHNETESIMEPFNSGTGTLLAPSVVGPGNMLFFQGSPGYVWTFQLPRNDGKLEKPKKVVSTCADKKSPDACEPAKLMVSAATEVYFVANRTLMATNGAENNTRVFQQFEQGVTHLLVGKSNSIFAVAGVEVYSGFSNSKTLKSGGEKLDSDVALIGVVGGTKVHILTVSGVLYELDAHVAKMKKLHTFDTKECTQPCAVGGIVADTQLLFIIGKTLYFGTKLVKKFDAVPTAIGLWHEQTKSTVLSVDNRQIWTTKGTPDSTKLLHEDRSAAAAWSAASFVYYQNLWYFSDSVGGLWSLNVEQNKTEEVSRVFCDFEPPTSPRCANQPSMLGAFGGILYMSAAQRVFSSKGSNDTTKLVYDVTCKSCTAPLRLQSCVRTGGTAPDSGDPGVLLFVLIGIGGILLIAIGAYCIIQSLNARRRRLANGYEQIT